MDVVAHHQCLGRDTNFYPNLGKGREHLFIIFKWKFDWILAAPNLLVHGLGVHGPHARRRLDALVQTWGELLTHLRVKVETALSRWFGRTRLGLLLKLLPVDSLHDRREYQNLNTLVKGVQNLVKNFLIQISSVIHPKDALAAFYNLGK